MRAVIKTMGKKPDDMNERGGVRGRADEKRFSFLRSLISWGGHVEGCSLARSSKFIQIYWRRSMKASLEALN